MPRKYVILTLFLCSTPLIPLFQSASATELDDVKASAIQKLESQRKIVDDIVRKLDFPEQQRIESTLMGTRYHYGNVVSERTHFELGQVGVSYRLIAKLMKASEDVSKCMRNISEEAQQEMENYLIDRFYRPSRENQFRLSRFILDRMFDWSYDKTNNYNEYNKLYKEAMDKIKNLENPNEISTVLDGVIKKGEYLIKITKEAIGDVNKAVVEMITFVDNQLNALKQFVRQKVDKTKEAVENCFLVNSVYYDIKSILEELP